MFKLPTTIITLTLIGSVAGFVWYKIWTLTSELDTTRIELNEVTYKANHLKLELAIEKGNVKELQDVLNSTNTKLKELTINKEKLEKDINTYRNKSLEERLANEELKKLLASNQEEKKTCEYGLKLNQYIGGLKYEDL